MQGCLDLRQAGEKQASGGCSAPPPPPLTAQLGKPLDQKTGQRINSFMARGKEKAKGFTNELGLSCLGKETERSSGEGMLEQPPSPMRSTALCASPEGPGNSVARWSPCPFPGAQGQLPALAWRRGCQPHTPALPLSRSLPAAFVPPLPAPFPGHSGSVGCPTASCLARALSAPRECCASIQQPPGPPLKRLIVQLAGLREPGYVEPALL